MCVWAGFVIKCRTITKELIQLRPSGPKKKLLGSEENKRRGEKKRQADRLKCHVNTWRWADFITKFSSSIKTLKALTFRREHPINQSRTITAEQRWDPGATTNIASFSVWASQPRQQCHIQSGTRRLGDQKRRVWVRRFISRQMKSIVCFFCPPIRKASWEKREHIVHCLFHIKLTPDCAALHPEMISLLSFCNVPFVICAFWVQKALTSFRLWCEKSSDSSNNNNSEKSVTLTESGVLRRRKD